MQFSLLSRMDLETMY